jgi:putative transcriptional regulator
VRILRDLAHSSRVLILLEIRRKPATKLKPLADAVGLTQQAVSGYLKQLEADGLARRAEGALRVTAAGEAMLQAEVGELKAFADRAARELVRVDTCVAVAGAPIKAGDRVGLFMMGGRLVAYPGRASPSSGVAGADAARERDVLVGSLEGIVEIAPAALTLVELPAGRDGGSGASDAAWLRELAKRSATGWWAAMDEVGEGALKRARLPFEFEFAPFESACAAVQRGVSPVFVGAPETVGMLVASIEAAKAQGRLPRFEYEVLRAKSGEARGKGGQGNSAR